MPKLEYLDPIGQLRYYLTLQLEAAERNDWFEHDRLSQEIEQLAKKI
ncbi:MAG: hypothetical protein JW816_04675 [Candidatus Buchananbacteria bacterium]|nr:hypothetical protein [Candidatus Buchananbacteria bacterium]